MRRKRSIPWIHRWSRPLMAGIASIGAVVTAYLTVAKLTGNSTARFRDIGSLPAIAIAIKHK